MTTRLLPQRSRFGDISLTGFVGSGGFSDVYAGHLPDGQQAAVKIFRGGGVDRESIKQRLERERDIVRSLMTSGIARLLDSDLEADVPWIASELIDGPTLRESVTSDGVMLEEEALGLIQSLATTLIELHSRGVAHRDITPNNVIIGPKGPVLIDFGSARTDLGDGNTRSHLLEGTLGYVSPEADRGEEVGRAADIYALARLAEFCIGGNDEDRIELPGPLAEALSSNPEDRPSAAAIASALPAGSELGKRNAPRVIDPLPRRLSPFAATAIGAFALFLGLLVGFVLSRPGPTTSFSMLGVSQLDGLTADEEQVLKIDTNRLQIENVRPIETGLGSSVGDLSGFQVRVLADPESVFDRCSDGDEIACDELWLGSPEGSIDKSFGLMCAGRGRLFETSCSGREVSEINPNLASGAFKLVALFESPPEGTALDSVPPEIRRRAGDLFERVERETLREDCFLEQADEANRLNGTGMLVWLAAESPDCEPDESGRRVVSGVVWQPGTPIAVEWVMRSTSNSAATRLLEGIGLNPTFGFPMIGETANSTDLVDLTQSIAVSRSPGYPDFFTSGFVLRIAPQSSVGFSVDEPTALSFRFALATEQPSEGFDGVKWGWIPAGFWWAREAGERRSIPNPTQSEALLWVQVEQNGSSGPSIRWKMTPDQQAGRTFDVLEVFSELFADEQLQLQPLRSTYDEPVFAPTLGNRLFILPSDAGSSDQATGGQGPVFTSRRCNDFELPTSLPAIQVTTAEVNCEATLALLADDSENYWEVAASQSDGSHFLIANADTFTLATRTSPQDWLFSGGAVPTSDARCDSQGGAEVRSLTGLTLEIVVSLDCPIADRHYVNLSGGVDKQTAPIFRFAIREGRFDYPLVFGSFSPQSVSELSAFGSFLSRLLLEPAQ